MEKKRFGRLDSVSLGGVAIFGALSVLLTILSQALGLNFPVIPYLQFDFGEVAILLSFFIFGPIPALVSAFIEFLTLMAIGQNVASFGPELKLIAIVASLLGLWLGTMIATRTGRPTMGKAFSFASGLGIVFRSALMTIPNYILIVFLFGIAGIVGFVGASFKLIGLTLTASNALGLILAFTAVFNGLQLLLVMAISYLVLRLPQVRNTRAAGRRPWIMSYLDRGSMTTSAQRAYP